jgi:spermidine synthase
MAQRLSKGQEALLNTDDLSYVEFAFARSVGRMRTGFSPELLRQLGIELGADRLEVGRGSADWQRVEELRLLSPNWIPPRRADLNASKLQTHRAVYEAYHRQQLPEALRLWRQAPWQPQDAMELRLVSELLVQQGDEAALPLLERLEASQPFDARHLRAQWLLGQGRHAEATQSLEIAFALLHQVPWSSNSVLKQTLSMSESIARKDAALGERLWNALARPFSNHRGETGRRQARLALASLLGFSQRCVEAFAPYEPHVPWMRSFLEKRARCYVETHHGLEDEALADLARFIDAEPPALLEDGENAPPP